MDKSPSRIPAATDLIVVLFCTGMARDIFTIWNSPYNFVPHGAIFFAIWALPLLLIRTLHWKQTKGPLSSPQLSLVGLALGCIGWLGSLNILKQIGLALSLVSLLPLGPFSLIWFTTSVTWMPASLWVLKPIIPFYIPYGRFAIILVGLACYFYTYHKSPRQQYE